MTTEAAKRMAGSVFCGECGARSTGGKFCTDCGRPLNALDEPPAAESSGLTGQASLVEANPPIVKWWRRRAVLVAASVAALAIIVIGTLVGLQQVQAGAHAQAVAAAHHAVASREQRAAAARALQAKEAAQKAADAAAAVAAVKAQDAADKAVWDQKAQADAASYVAALQATGGDGEVTGFPSYAGPTWSTIYDLYSCTAAKCIITFTTTSALPVGTQWGGPGGLPCAIVGDSTICSQTNVQDAQMDGGQTITRSVDLTGLVPAGSTISEFFLGDPTTHAPTNAPIQTRILVQAG